VVKRAAAALVIAAVGIPVAACGARHDGVRAWPTTPGRSTGAPLPPPGRVTAHIHLRHRPTGVTFGHGRLWVTADDGTVTAVDPATNRPLRTDAVGRWPVQVAFEPDALWVANSDDDTITRLDPPSGRRLRTIHVGPHPEGVAAAGGRLWVANGLDDTVTRIDTRRGTVAATIPVGPAPADLRVLALGDGAVWVTVRDALVRLDPRTDRVVARIIVHSPAGAAAGGGSVWVSNADDGTLTRIDARTNRVVTRVRVGVTPASVALAGGFAWVVNNGEGTVSQVDTATNRVVARIPVTAHAYDLTAGAGAVWIQSYADSSVFRIEPAPEHLGRGAA
jgi:YVTN family beta-propeller protein